MFSECLPNKIDLSMSVMAKVLLSLRRGGDDSLILVRFFVAFHSGLSEVLSDWRYVA